MLRFIVKRRVVDHIGETNDVFHRTIDVELPELENILTSGGFGENGSDHSELVGVEIIEEQS